MERPIQPDQIKVGEEDGRMFFSWAIKQNFNFLTFGVR